MVLEDVRDEGANVTRADVLAGRDCEEDQGVAREIRRSAERCRYADEVEPEEGSTSEDA